MGRLLRLCLLAAVAAPSFASPAPVTAAATPRAAGVRTATPGGTWTRQRPSPSGEPFYAVNCPTITRCVVGGALGVIELTADAGQTWSELDSGLSDTITGISCLDARRCVAVDDAGDATSTVDGGATWDVVAVDGGTRLNAVSCANWDAGDIPVCYAVGSGGAIFRTVDVGLTWTTSPSGVTTDLHGINCWVYAYCVAVGDGGTVIDTFDSGGTWTAQHSHTTADMLAVSCPYSGDLRSTPNCYATGKNAALVGGTPGFDTWGASSIPVTPPDHPDMPGISLGFAAATDGLIYQTQPLEWEPYIPTNGTPWTENGTPAAGSLHAISCNNYTGTVYGPDLLCMAVGDYSTAVVTHDRGTGWSPRPSVYNEGYGGFSCASASACVAIGVHGVLTYTNNGGASWPLVSSPASDNILGVDCPTTQRCLGVGNASGAIVTNDGGATWSSLATGVTADWFDISCPTADSCYAAGDKGKLMATSDGGAHWQAQTSGTSQLINSISCPSPTTCYASVSAVGIGPEAGAVAWTTDSGATWHKTAVSGFWSGIDCPNASTCYLMGAPGAGQTRVLASTDSGATWNDRSPPTGWYQTLYDISCPDVAVCYLTGNGATAVTVDGGASWTQTLGVLNTISCPTATTCFGGGSPAVIYATTNSGTVWNAQTVNIAPSTLDVRDVACPSATVCYSVASNRNSALGSVPGGAVLKSVNAGRDWFATHLESNLAPVGVSCLTSTTCYVVETGSGGGGYVLLTLDGGLTWTSQVVPSQTLVAIVCVSPTVCFARSDSGGVFRSDDSAKTWSQLTLPGGANALACPTATVCYVAGQVGTVNGPDDTVWRTTDSGSTWTRVFSVAGDPQSGGSQQPFNALACPSATSCYAVGSGPLIATTGDGVTWRTDDAPVVMDAVDVSCPATSTCFAISKNLVLKTTDYGGTWSVTMAGPAPYRALTCTSTSSCVAVGNVGLVGVTTNGGVGWAPAFPKEKTSSIAAVSCPDTSNCYAAAMNTMLTSHDGGASWSEVTFGNTDLMTGISCPTATRCFAVGWPGAIYMGGSGAWSYQPNPFSGADETLTDVSCPADSVCYAVGTGGHILRTTNGLNWTLMPSGTTQTLYGVSCSAVNSCVAVGKNGTSTAFDGTSWQVHATGTSRSLYAVSCPGSATCYAAGDSGQVLKSISSGSTWSALTSGTMYSLNAIQCTSSSACIAAGNVGTVVYTLDGTTWADDPIDSYNTYRGIAFQSPGRAWLVGDGGTVLSNPDLFHMCLSARLGSDKASPQPLGTTVSFTASAPAVCGEWEFSLLPPGGSWTVVQPYSGSSTWTWNTAPQRQGVYMVRLRARAAGSTSAFDTEVTMPFTLGPAVCGSAQLSAVPASPATAGTGVAVSAWATGCSNPRFEFWRRAATSTSWQIVQPYSASSTYSWDTNGAAGAYYVSVWAKDLGSTTASFDTNATISYTVNPSVCGSGALAPAPASPQVSGAQVTLTATAQCPHANPQYEFWMRPATSTSWKVVQPYSTSPTFHWNTSGSAGTFYLSVWIKDAGSKTSTFDTNATVPFAVTSAACKSVTITASPTTITRTVGSASHVTATASGCAHPGELYEFWFRTDYSSWTVARAWSTDSSYDLGWVGLPPGRVYISVWVKDVASGTATFDANATTTITIT